MVRAVKKGSMSSSGNYLSERTLATLTSLSILIAVLGFGYGSAARSDLGFKYRGLGQINDYRLEAALGQGTPQGITAFLVIAGILGSYLIYIMKNPIGKVFLSIPFIIVVSLLLVICYESSFNSSDAGGVTGSNTAGYSTIAYVTLVLFFNLTVCYYLYKENGGNKFYLIFSIISAIIYVLYLIGVHYSGLTLNDRIVNYATGDNQEFFDLTAACSILTTIFLTINILLLGFCRK